LTIIKHLEKKMEGAETTVGGKQTVKVSETDMKKEDPESELYIKKKKIKKSL